MPLPRSQLTASRRSLVFRLHPAVSLSFALLALIAVLIFGAIGVSVAQEVEAYRGYAWVPRLLMIVSAALMVCLLVRLLRRMWSRKNRRSM
ncbi:MAG: hypothetical protein MUC33_13935 [Desulfobacterales bacterium]|jgi:membrane protein DedA with SNARE-associated domain|nr:hypothetical protein [Desulfobacterales bacterium]